MFSSRVSTGTVSLKRPDLRGLDLGDALDRPRPLEVRAGLQHAGELAEAQHDAALLLGHQHEGVEGEPQDEQDGDPAADAAAAAPEQAAQGFEEAVETAAAAARCCQGLRPSLFDGPPGVFQAMHCSCGPRATPPPEAGAIGRARTGRF